MNIAPPQAGPGAPALGKKGRFCAEIGADYSGDWPNCNVARPLLCRNEQAKTGGLLAGVADAG
jgi:hypothetical protein